MTEKYLLINRVSVQTYADNFLGWIVNRSILITGNGLGMALNSDYFRLESGLKNIWNSKSYLDSDHKRLIQSAIEGASLDEPPKSETQLDKLQVAIIATKYLSGFEIEGASWISDSAKDLPKTFKKYIHDVAWYFHRSDKPLPISFVTPLSDFIQSTKTHVATLNYDNLLYDAFKNLRVLDGFSGTLLDGFLSDGFDEENMKRYYENKHGWYMHLHGSPLYVGNIKLTRQFKENINPSEDSHIVLCHVKHKPLIIIASHILSLYWRKLEEAFNEAERIILFGYSGDDEHLNYLINKHRKDKLLVVEWEGTGNYQDRISFWEKRTGFNKPQLIHKDNILDFNDWN